MLHELAYGMSAGKVDCPCGYIPSGTVNDFASSLNIPKDMQKCAAMIMQEHFQPVDLGRFNGGYFCVHLRVRVVHRRKLRDPCRKPRNVLGSFAYFLQGLKSFEPRYLKENSGRVRITWEHGVIEDDFIYCMIGNTHSVGGMKNLVPDGASLTDGMLDCMFVKSPKNLADLDELNRFMLTHDTDTDMIVSFKSARLRVSCQKPFRWTLDGEDGGQYTTAEIEVIPGALNIAIPV